jgi:hypothetical protein
MDWKHNLNLPFCVGSEKECDDTGMYRTENFCRRVFDKHTSFSTWRLVRFLRDLRVYQNQ